MLEKSSNLKQQNKKSVNKKYTNFNQILNIIYNEEINEIDSQIDEVNFGSIKIEPKIIYDKFSKTMKIEFEIGDKKMYKIKDLSEFYTNIIEKRFYKYGSRLEFKHIPEMFDDESKKILDFVMKYAEILKYSNFSNNSSYRYYGKILEESYITLGNTAIDEIFDILKGKKVSIKRDSSEVLVEFLDENPDMNFVLREKQNEYEIKPQFDIYKVVVVDGKRYKYILLGNTFYRCTKKFESCNLKVFNMFKNNYFNEITFGENELVNLFSIIMPKIKDAIVMEECLQKRFEQYIPKKLKVKVFLDIDKKGYIISEVLFCYGKDEFNPLKEEKQQIPRNILEESKILSIFRKTGFLLDIKKFRFVLTDDDKIYEFLSEEIEHYNKMFEVLATEKFKTKKIIKPKIATVGVKVENNLLNIDLENINIDVEEIVAILEKYKEKKKYYKLKDGNFLNLKESKEITFLENLIDGLDIHYEQLQNGKIGLPMNRILYLDQLLDKIKDTEIIKDNNYNNVIKNIDKENVDNIVIPDELKNVLRSYQKRGFTWLKNLDEYGLGGILADDMGLGKTVQILALLLDYIKNNKEHRTSLVVCPSSLALNWENEIKKFTKDINIKVIGGNSRERKNQISNLEKFDLIITSYDLLKRDIEEFEAKDYTFKYIIADEAQYLKNSNTQNAKTIKEIKADNRFALTGTPIENSLAELWSIFDFIMPGYLFAYRRFKSNYEIPIIKDYNYLAMNKLKMLIEPFILRRTKKEVLKELPEKTVTVLNNEMFEEQKKIYETYLLQAKQEIQEEINSKGYDRSQIKILAALTRLRQICCHPSLFIKDYKEESSKLEQCMEIIEDGINAEHKILLFSSYSSMFDIIENELNKRNIKYYKLTGKTKVDERVELVDDFNQNKEIKVFLISLKAGGTGLNLIGADMVIHYDPWWNISAENQATDRAYRIGQKNNVQVYKLITKDSIEEKIYDLQQRKEKLTNDMLDMKTTYISKLSKEDIMKLFD